jgi:hypothetical protein
MNQYNIVSPSLQGILSHDSIVYEGLKRPIKVMRIFDGPAAAEVSPEKSAENRKIIGQYFQDLYGVFMKKMSHFAIDPATAPVDGVQLQAMLQELIKVRAMMGKGDKEKEARSKE